MTLTWVSVTSGKASIGSDLNAASAPATKRRVPRTMNSGFCSANATMRLIIGTAPRSSRGAAAQLPMETMQEQVAFDDYFLAELEARSDARDAVPHGVDLHFLARVASRLVLDEDEVGAAREQQGALWDLDVRGRRLLELGGDEHLALELALAVLYGPAHLDRPRRGIDEVGDGVERGAESLVWPGRGAQRDLLARPQRRELVFRRVELHPQSRGIGDDEHRGGVGELQIGAQFLPGVDVALDDHSVDRAREREILVDGVVPGAVELHLADRACTLRVGARVVGLGGGEVLAR